MTNSRLLGYVCSGEDTWTRMTRVGGAGIFDRANFISLLGMKLVDVGEGSCSVELVADGRHLKQHGFVHAGVLGTLADHAAGGAA